MEEKVDIDQIILELEQWLACKDCGQMAHGIATPIDDTESLSCGRVDCISLYESLYEPFAPDNSFALTRDRLLQVARRCKEAEEYRENMKRQLGFNDGGQ